MKLMPASSAAMDDPDRLVVVGVAPGAEHHGPEAERADLDAGAAERAIVHRLDPSQPLLRAVAGGVSRPLGLEHARIG